LFYGTQLFFIWFLLKYYHFGFTVIYQIISYDRHINVLTVLCRIRTLLPRPCSAPPTIHRHDSLLLHCCRLGATLHGHDRTVIILSGALGHRTTIQ
jgi:hypothetical protein